MRLHPSHPPAYASGFSVKTSETRVLNVRFSLPIGVGLCDEEGNGS